MTELMAPPLAPSWLHGGSHVARAWSTTAVDLDLPVVHTCTAAMTAASTTRLRSDGDDSPRQHRAPALMEEF